MNPIETAVSELPRAMESDTAAREADIDGLINLLLFRHSSLFTFSSDHPHEEIIIMRQARDSAQAELKWRMLSTVGLLDWWDKHPQYIVGFAPSGDWAAFNAEHKTCYAPTTHDCLLKLQTMHNDLEARGLKV
jgi:hypothetical protein